MSEITTPWSNGKLSLYGRRVCSNLLWARICINVVFRMPWLLMTEPLKQNELHGKENKNICCNHSRWKNHSIKRQEERKWKSDNKVRCVSRQFGLQKMDRKSVYVFIDKYC